MSFFNTHFNDQSFLQWSTNTVSLFSFEAKCWWLSIFPPSGIYVHCHTATPLRVCQDAFLPAPSSPRTCSGLEMKGPRCEVYRPREETRQKKKSLSSGGTGSKLSFVIKASKVRMSEVVRQVLNSRGTWLAEIAHLPKDAFVRSAPSKLPRCVPSSRTCSAWSKRYLDCHYQVGFGRLTLPIVCPFSWLRARSTCTRIRLEFWLVLCMDQPMECLNAVQTVGAVVLSWVWFWIWMLAPPMEPS